MELKDYQTVARGIRRAALGPATRSVLTQALVETFKEADPLFDAAQFRRAVEGRS